MPQFTDVQLHCKKNFPCRNIDFNTIAMYSIWSFLQQNMYVYCKIILCKFSSWRTYVSCKTFKLKHIQNWTSHFLTKAYYIPVLICFLLLSKEYRKMDNLWRNLSLILQLWRLRKPRSRGHIWWQPSCWWGLSKEPWASTGHHTIRRGWAC